MSAAVPPSAERTASRVRPSRSSVRGAVGAGDGRVVAAGGSACAEQRDRVAWLLLDPVVGRRNSRPWIVYGKRPHHQLLPQVVQCPRGIRCRCAGGSPSGWCRRSARTRGRSGPAGRGAPATAGPAVSQRGRWDGVLAQAHLLAEWPDGEDQPTRFWLSDLPGDPRSRAWSAWQRSAGALNMTTAKCLIYVGAWQSCSPRTCSRAKSTAALAVRLVASARIRPRVRGRGSVPAETEESRVCLYESVLKGTAQGPPGCSGTWWARRVRQPWAPVLPQAPAPTHPCPRWS